MRKLYACVMFFFLTTPVYADGSGTSYDDGYRSAAQTIDYHPLLAELKFNPKQSTVPIFAGCSSGTGCQRYCPEGQSCSCWSDGPSCGCSECQ
jgi:hypothetical protein